MLGGEGCHLRWWCWFGHMPTLQCVAVWLVNALQLEHGEQQRLAMWSAC